jgi:hypothetical protein
LTEYQELSGKPEVSPAAGGLAALRRATGVTSDPATKPGLGTWLHARRRAAA